MRPHFAPRVVGCSVFTFLFAALTFAQGSSPNPAPHPLVTDPNQSKSSFCKKTPEEKARTGVLNASLSGASGLFSIFDAETLYCRTYLVSPGFETLGLSGRVRISQLHMTAAYGLTDRLEIFASTTPRQHAQVGSPNELSGFLLASALQRANQTTINSSLFSNTSGFFSLAGLDVSGALVGGVLPGFPQGASRLISDPILGRTKPAFKTPAFLNDFPFLGRGGSSYGDALTFGAKYRFNVIDEKKPATRYFSASVLGFVKIPSHFDNNPFDSAGNSNLFRGANSGVDFGVFLLGSFYLPVAPKYNHVSETNASNSTRSAKEPGYFQTLNHHINLGFVRNNDPSNGTSKLVDRRDAFVVGYGLDTMLNRYAQALGELEYQRFIGGGTPNLIERDPFDLTFGFRFYPGGLPQLRKVREGKVRSTNFWSIGIAYRLSLNSPGDFGTIGSARHNFVVQLGFGKTRIFGGLDRKCPNVLPCLDTDRAILSAISLANQRTKRGDVVTVTPQYQQGEFSLNEVSLYVDGKLTPNENLDEDGDPIPTAIKFKANLPPRSQPYQVRLVVQTKFEKTVLGRPDCAQATVTCAPSEAQAELFVVNAAPTLNLEPPVIGPISAQRAQTLSLTATFQDDDNDPVTLSWSAPPEIVLSGSQTDSVRSFDTGALQAGKRYRVSARASDGTESVERSTEIIVNNPPTVALRADHPNLLGVVPGDTVRMIASGNDLDNDALTYTWYLTGTTTEGNSISRSLSNGSPSNNVFDVITQDLDPGKYEVSVTASDNLDSSQPAQATFEIVRRAPQIFFEFDKHRLTRKERVKLDAEADWLRIDQNRTIEIRCEGNADRVGPPNYNLRLGCKRACTAKAYLIKKGIAPDRIMIAVSFGERKADQNRQRASDRRVDLSYSRREGLVSVVPGGAENCDCTKVFRRSKKANKSGSTVMLGWSSSSNAARLHARTSPRNSVRNRHGFHRCLHIMNADNVRAVKY